MTCVILQVRARVTIETSVKGQLTSFEDARNLVLAHCEPLGIHSLPITDCLGKVIAQPVLSLADSPRFDNSAVDGFGISSDDCSSGSTLEVIGESVAGKASDLTVAPGKAAKVLTGAPLPAGVSAVVMQEDTDLRAMSVTITSPVEPGANIRWRGEEYATGTELIRPGHVCTPATIALLSSAGHPACPVYRSPRVSILTTGDELVAPGSELGEGQIYASNGVGLVAALAALGIAATLRHVADNYRVSKTAVRECLEDSDVFITTGGVSVGERDYLKQAFADCGVMQHVWGVAMKPGQPFYFGSRDKRLVFGLPGNPVSALLTFFVLVRPAILKILGAADRATISATLASPVTAKGGRLEFVRGTLADGTVTPIEKRGSHMLGGLVDANCLIHMPAERTALDQGSTVSCTELKWSLP
jgi:molybdopterin molybdotransferase